MDFLFHEVSDKEKEQIKEEAKNIMDSFSKKLSKIDSKKLRESLIEREKGEREEGSGECLDLDRDVMFKNAPSKNDDFIIAEKKKW
jgi:Asp-tRNA(Asn)/Glu-tRNA(Gln) amidotransferase C subunit